MELIGSWMAWFVLAVGIDSTDRANTYSEKTFIFLSMFCEPSCQCIKHFNETYTMNLTSGYFEAPKESLSPGSLLLDVICPVIMTWHLYQNTAQSWKTGQS